MPNFHLAQLNIATLLEARDSPIMAEFDANLDRINALADQADGFIWRMLGDGAEADGWRPWGDEVLANMSVWRDVESLRDYAFKTVHADIMKRKREWFQRMADAYMVLWWVPAGHIPTLREAGERLDILRTKGACPEAFTFKDIFPPPG
jgi:hypothetical protein